MNKTPTFLEKKEKLEQLRFLEKGIKIKMAET
ncbi:MAG TPA: 3-deoxy-manno-octulosonate cytidylyltransferase, partial [Candidatus Cloacimonas sp.]|nr:3-deoxy-manno-octulosonate cytidylyltransferase [Candidatus Cloacimonas sp.]